MKNFKFLIFIFIFLLSINIRTDLKANTTKKTAEDIYNAVTNHLGFGWNDSPSIISGPMQKYADSWNSAENSILFFACHNSSSSKSLLMYTWQDIYNSNESELKELCAKNGYTYICPTLYMDDGKFYYYLSNRYNGLYSSNFNCLFHITQDNGYTYNYSWNGFSYNTNSSDYHVEIIDMNVSGSTFEDSVFDESLGKLTIKSSRFLNTNSKIYRDYLHIDTITSTDVDCTLPNYGIKCQIIFSTKDSSHSTDFFDLDSYNLVFDWKDKSFNISGFSTDVDMSEVVNYRIMIFPYFLNVDGTIKRGLFSSVGYGDYTSNGSYYNTREVGGFGGHRAGTVRPDGSDKLLDDFVAPMPIRTGSGLFYSDNDSITNKYYHEYHYPGEPDEITNNYIQNNITNPDSIKDVVDDVSVVDFDFGTLKAFLTGLYNFLFKLSKMLVIYLGLPTYLATFLNLGIYVVVFLIFGSLFKKIF